MWRADWEEERHNNPSNLGCASISVLVVRRPQRHRGRGGLKQRSSRGLLLLLDLRGVPSRGQAEGRVVALPLPDLRGVSSRQRWEGF